MMEKEFVTYEQALALKELGFDDLCLCTYSNGKFSRNPSHKMDSTPITEEPYTWCNSKVHNTVVSAPLKQQVFRWFRERKVLGEVRPIDCWGSWRFLISMEDSMAPFFVAYHSVDNEYSSYEEAESACIDKLIELVSNV